MKIRLTFISVVTLLSLNCANTDVVASDHKGTPPQVTTEEQTKLKFWDIPLLENAFIDPSPSNRDDMLTVGVLGAGGENKAMILKLAQEIADGKHGKFDSMLISKKDKLIFESYYNRGRVNLPHPQASALKVYTSMALGRAIQLGYLTMADLDKPIIQFFKDIDRTKLVKGAEKITLRNVLTMRSGLRITEEQLKELKKNPDQLKGQGYVQTLLEHSTPITEETQTFKYQDDPLLVMHVIDAVVPTSAKEFIEKELLNKIGIHTYRWLDNISGVPEAGWRASMTSRSMAKIGRLAMDKGWWNNEQLISKDYITAATSRALLTPNDDITDGGKNIFNKGYGYYWWNADMRINGKNYYSTSAQGGFGQFIIIIKDLDLMIVFTAHDNDTKYLQLAAERILPAFSQ